MTDSTFNKKMRNALSGGAAVVSKTQMNELLFLVKVQFRIRKRNERMGFGKLLFSQIRFIGMRIWGLEIVMAILGGFVLRELFMDSYFFKLCDSGSIYAFAAVYIPFISFWDGGNRRSCLFFYQENSDLPILIVFWRGNRNCGYRMDHWLRRTVCERLYAGLCVASPFAYRRWRAAFS